MLDIYSVQDVVFVCACVVVLVMGFQAGLDVK